MAATAALASRLSEEATRLELESSEAASSLKKEQERDKRLEKAQQDRKRGVREAARAAAEVVADLQVAP